MPATESANCRKIGLKQIRGGDYCQQKFRMSAAFKISFCAMLALAAALVSGCRSRGDEVWKNVRFVSSPSEATVFINGKNCGLTPRTTQLRRDTAYEVRFSKPGFFDENCSIVPVIGENGVPDIVGRVDVALTRITADASAARERERRGNTEVPAGTAVGAGTLASPAAVEFSRKAHPADFTERLLLESELKNLAQSGAISATEYEALRRRFSAGTNGEEQGGKTPDFPDAENGKNGDDS